MESHQHKMDPERVAEILTGLESGQDHEGGDYWDSVLAVDVAKRVRITLGVGGPTRWLDVIVGAEGDVQSAEYFDSWAVPDTYEVWNGSTEMAQVEAIIAMLGYDEPDDVR